MLIKGTSPIIVFCFFFCSFLLIGNASATNYMNVLKEVGSGSTALKLISSLFKNFDLQSYAIEGYFISCYLELVLMWIKMQLEISYSPAGAFEIFNFFEVLVPTFGNMGQNKEARFPEFDSGKSTSSSTFIESNKKGKEWLNSLLKIVKSKELSELISQLIVPGLELSKTTFSVPESQKIIDKQEYPFIEPIMKNISIWLAMADDVKKPGDIIGPIEYLASIVVKEIATKKPSTLTSSAKWAAKHPLGPSDSPMASPLLALGALLSQVIVQTLLVVIPKERFIEIVDMLKKWLDTPIEQKIKFRGSDFDIGQMVIEYIKSSLETSTSKASKLLMPEKGLTWGVLIGLLTMMLHRTKASSSERLTDPEVGSIAEHLTSVIKATQEGSRVSGSSFWNFFEGLPEPLSIKVTHWLGSVQAVSRLAIYALGEYRNAEYSSMDREVRLSVPFELLDVILDFPITATLDCPIKPSPSLLKAAVDVSITSWMIHFVGMIIHLDLMIGNREEINHDLAHLDRSSMSWSLLETIPCLFCKFYLWALVSTPKHEYKVKEELLKKIIAGFPISGVSIKSYSEVGSEPRKRLWENFFAPQDDLIKEELITLGGSISHEKDPEDSIKNWILQHLLTLFKDIEKNRKWNGPIGGCPQDPPPPEDKTPPIVPKEETDTSSKSNPQDLDSSSKGNTGDTEPIILPQPPITPGPIPEPTPESTSGSASDVASSPKSLEKSSGVSKCGFNPEKPDIPMPVIREGSRR